MPLKVVAVGTALAMLLSAVGVAAQSDRASEAGAGQAAAALERLRHDGVDGAVVDGLTVRLAAIRGDRWGPVPAAWLPDRIGAQVARLRALLQAIDDAERTALAAGRREVENALGQLAQADPGLPADELAAYRARSDRAHTPAELRRLTSEVGTAAATAAQQRQPALELEPQVATLRQRVTRASQLGIDTAEAAAAVAAHEALLKLPARLVAEREPAVAAQLRQAGESLAAAIDRAERARAGPVPPAAPSQRGRAVVIDLGDQYVFAYEDGSLKLSTPVTTGRPQLRTEQGTFHVMSKSSPYLFISPWPKGSPFYYPPTWVTWAVKFIGDGTYLHDAPWQPDGTYGRGSQDGSYASHGCVHVPRAVMSTLYGWLQVGDLVVVQA